MSPKIIRLFTFGLFLIVFGAILQFFDFPQAMLILSIGGVFELLAILLFVWNKLRKS
ncbi:MAG: gliding motility protein GldL [Lutibacter sp.]|jgi:hypothetical protein|nr:gliding motility protein GldL [Lutibacter sp.]